MLLPVMLSLVLAAAPPNEDIEVQASLSGYNLLWPTGRCCAFELHIDSSGRETVVLEVNTGEKPSQKTHETDLTPSQLWKIRSKLMQIDFFQIPTDFGFHVIDGDQRRLQVRLGSHSHTVNIPDGVAKDAPDDMKMFLSQLNSLWTLVTGYADTPQP